MTKKTVKSIFIYAVKLKLISNKYFLTYGIDQQYPNSTQYLMAWIILWDHSKHNASKNVFHNDQLFSPPSHNKHFPRNKRVKWGKLSYNKPDSIQYLMTWIILWDHSEHNASKNVFQNDQLFSPPSHNKHFPRNKRVKWGKLSYNKPDSIQYLMTWIILWDHSEHNASKNVFQNDQLFSPPSHNKHFPRNKRVKWGKLSYNKPDSIQYLMTWIILWDHSEHNASKNVFQNDQLFSPPSHNKHFPHNKRVKLGQILCYKKTRAIKLRLTARIKPKL